MDAALWLAMAVLAWGYFANDVGFAITHGGWRSGEATMLGRDFVNVYTSGHLVLEGGLANIYDVAWYQDYQSKLLGGEIAGHNYSYPPISFLFVWPFALLPYGLSLFAWLALTGTAFALAARPYLKDAGLPAWAALLIPAAIVNIWAGHYGFLIGACWLAGWRLVETRPRLAGLLFGLLAIKPHMAVLLPLALAWRGAWVPFRFAAYTVGALVLASGFLFGWSQWLTYLTETASFQASLLSRTQAFYMTMMPSVVPSLGLAGVPAAIAWTVQVFAAIGAVAILLSRMPHDNATAGLVTAVATTLVVPYIFNYDLTVVSVAACLLLYQRSPDRPVALVAAMAAFLLPLLLPILGTHGVPLGPIVMAALLWTITTAQGRRPRFTAGRGKDRAQPSSMLEQA